MTSLRIILCDQLSEDISSLEGYDFDKDMVLMCEARDMFNNVKHHKKKIAFLMSAMRHFSARLQQKGYCVTYTQLSRKKRSISLKDEIQKLLDSKNISRIILAHPGEYRMLEDLRSWEKDFKTPIEIRDDHRFLCSIDEFSSWAAGRKQLRMEYFYREMRKKYDILMQNGNPIGDKWNFDALNRKPPKEGLHIPPPFTNQKDAITQEVMDIVSEQFSDHFGDLEPFYFAVTRQQALDALHQFIQQRLIHFGDYQDAMIQGEPWMYHAHISFYLNCGLLSPLECAQAAEQAFQQGKVPLNATEGFIRQIIGWREYVRGIYWLKMPEYASLNFLEATNKLPDFYWTGQTKMNCLKNCVTETKKNAYAHHIQRLMVLGNFALLAGIDPKYVNEWFLIVYADAYQWVELPNVSGMILFADGGYLASKPYASGGSYINKMSDYCKSCKYKVAQKNGPDACPFNYLYWDFLDRNREKVSNNPRIAMMYRTYDRMDEVKRKAIKEDSSKFLKNMDDS